eukprot:SAG11_NODE_5954_length_1425_cov_5.387632_1_plen_30_part_10
MGGSAASTTANLDTLETTTNLSLEFQKVSR